MYFFFFFFNDTATTEIYTLSLHDALPISAPACRACWAGRCRPRLRTPHPPWSWCVPAACAPSPTAATSAFPASRSEEHTSELQSPCNLVCRLLLEKKKITANTISGQASHT